MGWLCALAENVYQRQLTICQCSMLKAAVVVVVACSIWAGVSEVRMGPLRWARRAWSRGRRAHMSTDIEDGRRSSLERQLLLCF